jgi:BirA family transcriptional regulator, biotin operon repressor / biotin---[acetyl-CoA-carboxylase] ligase
MNPREVWQLDTSCIGRRVLVFDRLDSTNNFAQAYADDPANDGLVVLADEQTAGRGQHGRTWTCPGGAGVLMSVLIFPPAALQRAAILTAWAAVSVCELIRQTTGLEANIKWPNDVLISGRKVCGILIEQTRGAVVGIGLNVNQPAKYFEASGLTEGTSLAAVARRQYVCRDIARQLIETMDVEYGRLCQGDVGTLEAKWQQRFGLLGRRVEIATATQVFSGLLRSLAFEGLAIELPDQCVELVAPETVKHVVG